MQNGLKIILTLILAILAVMPFSFDDDQAASKRIDWVENALINGIMSNINEDSQKMSKHLEEKSIKTFADWKSGNL